ncbi:fused MFS/spermidine synthase [Allosphingosinicella sp.]|uniref:fused MFS/spermidine synthase n=1 Tax=Allosphingosinicella sp. TaxID=2823234 RepID=UPI0037847370
MTKRNRRQLAAANEAKAGEGETAAKPQPAAPRVNERYARPLFVLTIVTGSFLLFLTQPMIARMALPRVGGAPSVWNSAMLVYQLLLLAGYAYAHWAARLRPRRQVGLHIVLLGVAALWLPIGLTSAIPPSNFEPALWVPWFLLSSIGPVFFIVSAQAPLMQRWYALETSRGDPYPLYAASNLGSFAGLISYPLIVEPLMSLSQQSWLWTAMYAFLVLLVVACAFTVPADAVEVLPEETEAPPTTRRYLHWIALAAVPSGLMLSTTTHLTTDIVAIPMLWVLPLGLYLLSFVIAFSARRKPANFITMLAPIIILVAGGLVFGRGTENPLYPVTLGLLLLFAIAVALHGEMFRLRPAAGHLTRFYLAMSVGGMLGGLFCAIVAPLVFDWAYEYPLLVLGAALLVPQIPLVPWIKGQEWLMRLALPTMAILLAVAVYLMRSRGMSAQFILVGSIAISLVALACLGRRVAFAVCLLALMVSYDDRGVLQTSFTGGRTRSYFGIYEVYDRADGSARVLTHGTTLHGIQNLDPAHELVPTSYYAARSGVGIALTNADSLYGAHPSVGIVGLGSGTLSCYAHPNERWTIFEIDPAMVEVARHRFTFLNRCAPQAQIVLGDARLSIARQPANSIDILAVDAFSSDAVPMHLLTHEALQVYGRAVQPNGIVLFHISNRYLDLRPVIAELAQSSGWAAAMLEYVPTEEEQAQNATISVWIAMSRNPEMLNRLAQLSGDDATAWRTVDPRPGFTGWTDDHASILSIINFESFLPRGTR